MIKPTNFVFVELLVTDSFITLQFMQYQLHSNEEYVRFFVNI